MNLTEIKNFLGTLVKNLYNILKFPVLAIFIIIILLYLPDFLLFIRYNIDTIPFVQAHITIYDVNKNPSEYIEITVAILACFITGSLSVLAYQLSKRLGMLELNTQELKQTVLARNISKNIDYNCTVIHDTNRNMGNLSDIKYEKDLETDWIFLYKTKAINEKEKNFLEEYNSKILSIKGLMDNDEEKARNVAKEFGEKYFTKSPRLQYQETLKTVYSKLEEIIVRRREDV